MLAKFAVVVIAFYLGLVAGGLSAEKHYQLFKHIRLPAGCINIKQLKSNEEKLREYLKTYVPGFCERAY